MADFLTAVLSAAIILITHDMGVVAETADRVIVMQAGRAVEAGPTTEIFAHPRHDYTRSLLAAVPRIGDRTAQPRKTEDSAAQPRMTGAGAAQPRRTGEGDPVARLSDVSVRFPLRGGVLGRVRAQVHAVEHVSLSIRRGETLSLVGESGCGKSTIARAIVGLVPHSGRIEVAGRALADLDRRGRMAMRRRVQIVFQDPMAALDPRMTAGALIAEPLVIHRVGGPREQAARVADLLTRVGLSPEHAARYPHEFSGGQRQRICIARALALQPDLIIADEAVSALDVSVQARVLDLLRTVQREFGVALLFISHDMAVVENISDRVAVMYLGQIVETGTRDQVFGDPRHPYTRRLIDAAPIPDLARRRPPSVRLTSEIPSPIHPIGQGPQRVTLRDVGGGHLAAIG